MLVTSERSLLTVLLPARQLRERIEISFQAALAELLAALQLPAQVVSRELAAVEPISFAAASNRRVIGSMNEYVWQLGSYLVRTGDLLELSLQLNNIPMSAVGSKSSYGFPDEVARELLMNLGALVSGGAGTRRDSLAPKLDPNWTPGRVKTEPKRILDRKRS